MLGITVNTWMQRGQHNYTSGIVSEKNLSLRIFKRGVSEWWFYTLTASKAVFSAIAFCILLSPEMMVVMMMIGDFQAVAIAYIIIAQTPCLAL